MPTSPSQPVVAVAPRKSRSLKNEVARLEAELKVSRQREEVARNALMTMHRELEDAYVRIGRQQEKLTQLVETLHPRCSSTWTGPARS
jgi:chromosome segregation ATPase